MKFPIMKKALFLLVAIVALQVSTWASSLTETPCLEEEISCLIEEAQAEYVNCLAARANAESQVQIMVENGECTNEDAKRAFCIIWKYSTNGQCGPCRFNVSY